MKHPLALALLATVVTAQAADKREIMFSRYMGYLGCMSRAHGQYFHETHKLEMRLNKWGASEPTLSSLSKQSAAFQKSEAACREANDLQLEPRPQ